MDHTQDMLHHLDHHDHHHGRHHHHDGILHQMNDMMSMATIASLRSELEHLQNQRAQILSEMQPYEDVLRQAEAQVIALRSRQTWLKKHLPAATTFLATLNDTPQESVTALANTLTKAFTEYEDSHLTLSPQVRISLIAVRYGLHDLLVQPVGFAPDYAMQQQRTNYLRLT
ncbi:MAG: hypothetical protein ACRCXC_01405 [Legionella sp.]